MPSAIPRLFIAVSSETKLRVERKAREMGLPTSGYLRYLFILGEKEHDRMQEAAKKELR